jgi:3-oxoacyl-[acyl-carrier protein] reductase
VDLGLTDKIACVSGSTRGIGFAIADALLREGARVAVSGRTREGLSAATKELGRRWGADRVLGYQGDLTQEATVAAFLADVVRKWGGLDLVIANLGSGKGTKGWNMEAAEWVRQLEVNLIGGARLAGGAVPELKKRGGGSIVFVSSLAGVEAVSAPISYGAAKAGVIALSKMLARQLAPDGIRVNVVAPGNILFPDGVWAKKSEEDHAGVTAYLTAEVPMARLGKPEEVADAVTFLASSRASFITGACVLVDGGQSRGW